MDFKVGDRVRGLGLGTVVDILPIPMGGNNGRVLWTEIYVRYDSDSFDFLGRPSDRAVKHTGSNSSLCLISAAKSIPPGFCPECEEEDYFFVDDYICGPCRDERGF